MKVPKISLKEAEKAVKKASFKIEAGELYSKKRQKKADKFEKKHGFRYEDAWNLDNSIACFILPRLIQLRDTTCGYPGSFVVEENGFEKWQEILNEMIYGFYIYVVKDSLFWDDEDKKAWFRAKCWFIKYYESLWD